ncbi:MAG: TonB-dependent receptor [Gammaproteobacteria bacterium]|nr:TonB-dependent receptor [Gammaproteobacteria bacterium]
MTALGVGTLATPAAWAVDLQVPVALHIAAQPLEAALMDLSRQGNTQLVIATDSVPARISVPISGSLSLASALERLLEGTGLSYKLVGSSTIAIVKADAGARPDTDAGAAAVPGEPAREAAPADRGGNGSNHGNKENRTVQHRGIFMRLVGLFAACGSALSMGPACAQAASETPATIAAASGIEEVIVTASRRRESAQTSSLALAVIGGDELTAAGVTQASELATLVPGLTISQGGSTVQTYLRGVGNFATDASAESAIAYSINGVYISRPNGLGPIFFDLERVEILKGPQGTLYGRNASGGAINLITTRPGQETTLEASLDLGNYDLRRVTGIIGGGLTDTLAVRAAVQRTARDGYLTDGYNDQDTLAARLTALWEPTDALTLLLTGEYTDLGGMGETSVKRSLLTAMPTDPWQGPSVGNLSQPPTAFIPTGPGTFGTRITTDGYVDGRVRAVAANVDAHLGPLTLTYIPAYRDLRMDYRTFAPAFNYTLAETSRQQSHELRLAGDDPRLKWVAGLYHFREDQTQLSELQALPLQNNITDIGLRNRSYAAFGDVNFGVREHLRLIAGIRYSRDDKGQEGTTRAILPRPGLTNNHGQREFGKTSWRAGIEYDLGPASLLFATVGTGFKAGGFFPSASAPNNSFGPETLTAYTFGSRNRFRDNTVQVNIEGFYWKYADKQERYLGAIGQTGAFSLLTTNAGQATLYGANVDVVYRPTAADQFNVALEYLHSRYDEFRYRVYAPPPFGLAYGYGTLATRCRLGPIVPVTGNDPFVPTDATQEIDCSGKPLVRAPEWSGTIAYQHGFSFAGGSQIIIGVDSQLASSQYLYPDFVESGKDDGYATLNADLTYRSRGGRYAITAWGRNLGQAAIYTGGIRYSFSAPVAPQGDPTLFYANIRPPRTFGLTLKVSY